jgi:hypothetical protein
MGELCLIGLYRIIIQNIMKNLRIMAIMICSVLTLASCETEELQGPSIEHSESKEKIVNNKDGGGDDEEPIIIYGLTQNESNFPIENAEVKIFDASTSNNITVEYTDVNGNFEFNEEAGVYYFEVSANGYQILQTTNYTFTGGINNIVLTLN